MSVPVQTLLELCEKTYSSCAIVGGPLGRDGANVFRIPSGEIVVCFRGTLVEHDFRSVMDWIA